MFELIVFILGSLLIIFSVMILFTVCLEEQIKKFEEWSKNLKNFF